MSYSKVFPGLLGICYNSIPIQYQLAPHFCIINCTKIHYQNSQHLTASLVSGQISLRSFPMLHSTCWLGNAVIWGLDWVRRVISKIVGSQVPQQKANFPIGSWQEVSCLPYEGHESLPMELFEYFQNMEIIWIWKFYQRMWLQRKGDKKKITCPLIFKVINHSFIKCYLVKVIS